MKPAVCPNDYLKLNGTCYLMPGKILSYQSDEQVRQSVKLLTWLCNAKGASLARITTWKQAKTFADVVKVSLHLKNNLSLK